MLQIAVIGAGPMGLAVGYQLALDGHRPVVFESEDRIGGMAASIEFGGVKLERYYHFYCTSDHDLRALLDELKSDNEIRWVKTTMGFWFDNILQPWGNPFALLKFRGIGLISKIRYGLHIFLATNVKNWPKLESTDASSWIRKWVGDSAFQALWSDLFTFKFYHFADDVSATWIWKRIRRIGKSRSSIFSEQLGYLENGTEALLEELSAKIKLNGGEIRLNTPVEKIITEGGKIGGVNAAGTYEQFDCVISTIPLPYVTRLLPDVKSEYIDMLDDKTNIAVVCVLVQLTKPVSSYFWVNTHDDEMDIPGFVEYSNLRTLNTSIVYVPFYLPFDHPNFKDGDDEFVRKVRSYLIKINSHLSEEDFLDFRVSRYRYAQPVCQPGYLDSLPPLNLGIQGLMVADTSYYYPEDRGLSESIGFGRKMAVEIIDITK